MKRLINHSPTLLRLVVLLLLSNIILAALFFFRGKKEDERTYKSNEAIEAEVKKELGLSEEQAAQFRLMLKKNRDTLKILGGELREAKKGFYELLPQTAAGDSLVMVRSNAIGERQAAMDNQMFTHFREVRSILNDSQRPLYDSMVMRMMSRSAWARKKEDAGKK